MERLALLISGGGTTAEKILNECKSGGKLEGQITPVVLISSRKTAGGLEKARATGMLKDEDILVIRPQEHTSSRDFGIALAEECDRRQVTLFGQYGWMTKTPANFLNFVKRGINQHPAPLCPGKPDFGGEGMFGMRCHAAVLLFRRFTQRDFWTKAVAQRVAPEFDLGAVLKEEQVPILKTDTPESLQKRVLEAEYRVQIQTLLDFAHARVDEVQCEELVLPHEKALWMIAREDAIKLYPKG